MVMALQTAPLGRPDLVPPTSWAFLSVLVELGPLQNLRLVAQASCWLQFPRSVRGRRCSAWSARIYTWLVPVAGPICGVLVGQRTDIPGDVPSVDLEVAAGMLAHGCHAG